MTGEMLCTEEEMEERQASVNLYLVSGMNNNDLYVLIQCFLLQIFY